MYSLPTSVLLCPIAYPLSHGCIFTTGFYPVLHKKAKQTEVHEAILGSKSVRFEHCYTILYKKQVCKQISYVNIQGNKDFYLFKQEH